MTDQHEFNATTLEEALEKASERLGVPVDKLSYDVVDGGSPGFLGIGARDARIVVSSPGSAEAPGESEEFEAPGPDTALVQGVDAEHFSEEQVPNSTTNDLASEGSSQVPDGLIADIERFVVQVVEAMGFEARISVYDAGEFVAVDVNSSETGLFIGQKGETIDALQYLINVSVYRSRPFAKRIVVDSEGYRQRRIEAVQGIAHRMARKAVRESKLVELPPMNSAERRVVHLFLKDNPAVDTSSEGTGDNRRVTISPLH